MDLPVRNQSDLRAEIIRLKDVEREQSIAIGQRFKNFSATLSTLGTLFPRTLTPEGKSASFFDQDLVGLISRFLLPFTLNKTIFRKSGFLVKAIVGLISQKASHFISEDTVMSTWDKIKDLFSKKKKKTDNISDEKGIPPLSESY
ncbi:hypothetical protein [Mucilaginibacter sp. L3T2-6]|uniref:hypothetical protein n=1 Tax=Mucilaginibacter sp. L3T2-6 TaxID=3062491 RepID=UPI0026773188|nr:hypothetical protein [Mucilaginibacter sp. L3T2-6]MDO3642312.1 hypothetical protein [Mucilaginibacter sp. L3T2-6]MDV6214807.1 hypothetical protein [Mucilaginibacter sp. L3T2-6]